MAGYKAYLSEDSKLIEGWIHLDKKESHHLCRVLRLKKGTEVRVLDGLGQVYETRIEEASAKGAVLKIHSKGSRVAPKVKIKLLLSIPKLKAMDLILKACVEIGIHSIQPILSDHCAFHLDAKQTEEKMQKWSNSLIEAAKQCENAFIPKLESIQGLNRYWDAFEIPESEQLNLVASLEPGSLALSETLNKEYNEQESLCLAIGPEGDFSKNEYALFQSKGFKHVRLSQHVLRTETAVFYGLSVIDQMVQNSALK